MDQLLKQIKSIRDVNEAKELLYDLNEDDQEIKRALEFATLKHIDQFRKSGEPYIIHPILVACIVSHFGGDEEMVIAALLHDVVEDTECTREDINNIFNHQVAQLVDGLTKITEMREEELLPSSSNEKLITSALSFRKMLLASIGDVRVLVIKLCDRVHNMLTLDALSPSKQKRISEETLVVYAPIAHRLGISKIKNILEDTSFYYILPQEYGIIENYFSNSDQQLQLSLNHFISKVKEMMLKNGFIDGSFTIEKRIKHYYSIYMKIHRKGISLEEILDLMAIRILVKEPLDCYRVLGILHQNFNPLISRFKDYISIPKDNGYQTIHTTVFDNASIFEAQIRTYEMHDTAEFGIAAHWKYKGHSGLNPKLEWLNELKNQSEEGESIEEMYELAKDDLYSEDISVFSPRGDVFSLPRGATVLDFAYSIHTEIGNHTKGSFVNKIKTPLLTELKNGDIIRIETVPEKVLRCSWINALKTTKARNIMKQNCKQKAKELNILIAKNILLRIFGIKIDTLNLILKEENLEKNIYKSAVDSIHLQENIYKLKKALLRKTKFLPIIPPFRKYELKKQVIENIIFQSIQGVSGISFDYCCHPKRGDEIVAFKKGTGAIIHHKFCTHATQMMEEYKPMHFVSWCKIHQNAYKLIISIENKKGSLAYFLLFLAKIDANLLTIQLSQTENSHTDFFEMVIEMPDESRQKLLTNRKEEYKIIEFIPIDDAYKKI